MPIGLVSMTLPTQVMGPVPVTRLQSYGPGERSSGVALNRLATRGAHPRYYVHAGRAQETLSSAHAKDVRSVRINFRV